MNTLAIDIGGTRFAMAVFDAGGVMKNGTGTATPDEVLAAGERWDQ